MPPEFSGLTAAGLARLNAMTNIQNVAVRLIAVPEGLTNQPTPVKVDGTVIGQNPDGSTQVQTERGTIAILLRDRQSLPQGMQIEIEIPPGRAPQQATIRPATEPTAPAPAQPSTPPASSSAQTSSPIPPASQSLAAQVQAMPSSSSVPRLDRDAALKTAALQEALLNAAKFTETGPLKASSLPLQPGQSMRLIPMPPGMALPMQQGQVAALPEAVLLGALTDLVEQLPPSPLKTDLTAVLQRMDMGAAKSLAPATPQPVQPASPLSQARQNAGAAPDTAAPHSAPALRYAPISLFNPARPVDMQVIGFLTTTLKPSQAAALLPGQIQVQPQPIAIQPSVLPAASGGSATPASGSAPQPAMSSMQQPSPLPVTPQPAPALPSQIVPGQVLGFTPQNLPVISVTVPAVGFAQTYVGQFQAGNLQPGSPLLMSVLPDTQTVSAQPLAPSTLPAWMEPGAWDSMTDFLQTMRQINPALAQGFSQMLPSPAQPHNMGALAMFFMAAIKARDIDAWLPPHMAMMMKQAGKSDILRAVTGGDSAMAARAETATLPQDWRAAVFPLYHEQQISKVPLYYKRMEEDDTSESDERRRKKMLRFLFDLRLTRMGDVQVDGFMQPERLDMVLRTKTAMSVPMQKTMKGLYVAAMEKSNLRGELSFQFRPEQWVEIDVPLTMDDSVVSA